MKNIFEQHTWNKQRGFALLPVAIALVVIGSISLLVNYQSANSVNQTASAIDIKRTEYVAQAGMQHGLYQAQAQGCGPHTDIINVDFGDDKYSTSLTTNLGSTVTQTIIVDQDGWIRDDNTSKTHPSDSELHFRSDNKIERPVYRYDLSPIPTKSSIISATAFFYLSKEHPEGPIEIHALTTDWNEDNANWDLLGDAMDANVLATIPTQPTKNVWIAVNLTSQVQAWVNGQSNFGITLNSLGEGAHGDYSSRESSHPPYLEVVIGTPPAADATLKSVATSQNGLSRTIQRDLLLRQFTDDYYELRPDGSNGVDAEIWEQSPDNNYGDAGETWVSSASNDTTRSLLRFDLSTIPFGAHVIDASLSLERQSGSGTDQAISAHRIRDSWSENFVTWNRRTIGVNWNTAGGDFDSNGVTTTLVGPSNQRYSWEITPLVQGWVDGRYPNYGVILVAATPGMIGERFYTSDENNYDRRPILTVTYRCQCGIACIAPQGNNGRIILIGNWPGIFPDAYDLEKENIIESWGYRVDHADDDFIWAINFNNYDLVYVSETARASVVNGQLSSRSIGIVIEEGGLYSDMGFADSDIGAVDSLLNIVNNDHYITSIFAADNLPIYNAEMEFIHASGNKSTGMKTLGTVAGSESLMILDVGDTTLSGGSAPGRRVALPLGRFTDTEFNWNYLNNNGRLLVQRSIAWAMGMDNLPPADTVLMVVGNPDNLTSQEIAKQALIESWNFGVTLIDEDDSQAAFDSAVALSDVVFISEAVNSNDVNTKLTDVTIGVVIEEAQLADEFGLSDGISWSSGNSINVQDNTHFITQPFQLGSLTILSTAESLMYLTPSFSSDLQQLADIPNGSTLATLEAGASILSSGFSAGRRVILPWGGNDMDVNNLNAAGLTIFQRSLEWANGENLAGPVAHWELDESSGTDAVDSIADNDGTLAGNPSWESGILEGALDFDGDGDRVDAPPILKAGSSQISVLAWVYKRDLGDDRVLSKSSGTNVSDHIFSLGVGGDVIRVRLKTADNGGSDDYDAGTISLNTWTHLAFTYDGAVLRIYKDGNESAQYAFTGDIEASSLPVVIGNVNNSANRYWNGLLDDVQIYDRALSSGEISVLATPPPAVPIAHWKLDDGTGNTALDTIGNYDGTLENGPIWSNDGVLDGALTFDGINDQIMIPHDTSISSFSALTISAWINYESKSFPLPYRIISKETLGFNDNFWLAIYNQNLYFSIEGDVFSPSSLFLSDRWYHVAATFDDNANRVQIFVDGVEVLTQSTNASLSPNTADLYLGNNWENKAWAGLMDDIRLYDQALTTNQIAMLASIGGGTPSLVDTNGCNGTFRDDFNNEGSYSGDDGSLSWSGPWQEIGESDGADNGDIRITEDDDHESSEFQLRTKDNDNGGEGVEREADLTNATNAILKYDFRRQGLDNSNDYTAVSISANGAAGPWIELTRHQGSGSDSNYQSIQHNISSYISSNTRVRFKTSPSMGGNDRVWFDNIEIECSE